MKLLVKPSVFSLRGKMEVLDEGGCVAYRVETELFGLPVNETTIADASGEPVALIRPKAFSLHAIHFVRLADGTAFTFEREPFALKERVEIPELGWELRGRNILDLDFEVRDGDDAVVATAHRELFSWGDPHVLDVEDAADVPAVLAIFVVLIQLRARQAASTAPAAPAA